MRREFLVLAEGRHIFGRRPKPRAGHYKDLTEPENAIEKSLAPRVDGRRRKRGRQGVKSYPEWQALKKGRKMCVAIF